MEEEIGTQSLSPISGLFSLFQTLCFREISLRALIRNPEQEAAQAQDEDLEQRISAVTESLQLLEVGVAESGVMLSLAAHFDMMESEKSLTKMEMRRVKVNIS